MQDFPMNKSTKVEKHGGTEKQSMMSATIGEKRITYVACRRCGRIYGTGDHRSCPDCHGRRRAVFTGLPANDQTEETPVFRRP
jgi:uncharacterized OB-fold protein